MPSLSNKQKGLMIVILGSLIFPFLMVSIGFEYAILIGCFFELYLIAVNGMDVVFGYCGQISMGHAAFYAIGAYGSALLHNKLGIPVVFTMIIASVIGALIGALIAFPASRLVFHFLSLATIAFGEIVYQLISHSPNNFTGNFNGLFTSRINIFGLELKSSFSFYFFGLICLALFLLAKHGIVNSRVGRAFIAIRENTHAADGMGINVRKYKVIAFTISAFYTAFAGSMYAHLIGYISPDTFIQKQSVLFVTMLLFGGTTSLLGPALGVLSLLLLTEALRSLQDYQMIIYGALLLLVIVALPGGIYGGIKDIYGLIKGSIKRTMGGEKNASS
ncbi:MAG: branched-chain amino acid ABC transporter permease [Acetivibrionales bacterium]|jgi:branched-chain amino acid transport system permease protein